MAEAPFSLISFRILLLVKVTQFSSFIKIKYNVLVDAPLIFYHPLKLNIIFVGALTVLIIH